MKPAPVSENAPRALIFGPDRADDLRECRPYFFVPLDYPEDSQAVGARILAHMARMRAAKRPVTDLYILSHGWHRNFYAGVQAYDRIASRFAVLLRRSLPDPSRMPRDDDYTPLIATLHWHSDPGKDAWEDSAGRRTKTGFLENVRNAFIPGSQADWTSFVNDFEDLYDLFSRVSAPGTRDIRDACYDADARRLTQRLRCYQIKNVPDSEAGAPNPPLAVAQTETQEDTTSLDDHLPEKVALAWTCYHDAPPQRVLLDQDERPGHYMSLGQAIASLFKFTVGSLGLLTFVGIIFQLLWMLFRAGTGVNSPLDHLKSGLAALLRRLPPLETEWNQASGAFAAFSQVAANTLAPFWKVGAAALKHVPPTGVSGETKLILIACFLAAAGLLWLTSVWRKLLQMEDAPGKALPLPAVLAWAYLQIWCALPLACYCIATYFTSFVGGLAARLPISNLRPILYDERIGRRGDDLRRVKGLYIRYYLALLAQWPIPLLRNAVAKDSSVRTLAAMLEAQLAFWEMQRKGVEKGESAATFIAELLNAMSETERANIRIHVMGHSFGGLLVANMIRHLAIWREAPEKARTSGRPFVPVPRGVDTLCLVQGALASGWFEREPLICRYVQGALANIYSAYDTANGFYYPLANHGRLAAGYVGLTKVGDRAPEFRCEFPALVRTPDLDDGSHTQCAPSRGQTQPSSAASPRVLNVDASRLIFNGSVVLGGGHDDIFKDDIIYLIWAITRLSPAHSRAVVQNVEPKPTPHLAAR